MVIPYIDRGPRGDGGSSRPSDRKLGVVLFTMFCMRRPRDHLPGRLLPRPGLHLHRAVTTAFLRAKMKKNRDGALWFVGSYHVARSRRTPIGNWVTGSSHAGRSHRRSRATCCARCARVARPGMSRRTLIRRSIGAAVALWLLEVTGGMLGFLWPNLSRGFGGQITLGDQATVSGSPAVQGADAVRRRAVVLLAGAHVRPAARLRRAASTTAPARMARATPRTCGRSTSAVRTWAASPTSAPRNYWFECPCHGSRYDRLGTKIQELGPAPRSLDRFAHTVAGGVLTVDTSKITLGPAACRARPARA